MKTRTNKRLRWVVMFASFVICFSTFTAAMAQSSTPVLPKQPDMPSMPNMPRFTPSWSKSKPNQELQMLFQQDQADRQQITEGLAERDRERRKRALELYNANELKVGLDFYHAGFIFQHGEEPEDYLLAHELAVAALPFNDEGAEKAKWLTAATEDRYLLSLKRPQRFGTQFVSDTSLDPQGRCLKLYDVDTTDRGVTDEHRQLLNVPTLEQAKETLKQLNQNCPNKK